MIFSKYIKPSFLIVGGIKCGTSSLYRYLNAHPQVLPCKVKEPQVFSTRNPLRTLAQLPKYAKLFPPKKHDKAIQENWVDLNEQGKLVNTVIEKKREVGQHYITGEASANTLITGLPFMVKTILPSAKIIMLVRNPTDRFYSHYRMYNRFTKEKKAGFELPPLRQFVNEEIQNYKEGRKNKILHHGVYTDFLPKWKKTFGDEQFRLFSNQQLEEQARSVMQELCDFLNLEPFDFGTTTSVKYNQASYTEMPEDVKTLLDDFYAPSVEQLRVAYGIDLEGNKHRKV